MLFLRVIAWYGAEKFSLKKKVVSIFTSGGNMSFVGTRPEAVKYVEKYKSEYFATLLLPAGITSEASIRYKDEAKLLDEAKDVDKVYLENVLPGKMQYNLESISKFSFLKEIVTMIRTVKAVLGKEYK